MTVEFWESAARRDPLWAVLSDPSKRGRKWDLHEFLETGRREISLLLYQLAQLRYSPTYGRALDFGCGVGRLTQALSASFPEVVGVDVSPTMLEIAARVNQSPATVRYVLNARDDLQQFAANSFDFVYSDIVLQHIAPPASARYVAEFLRVLRAGGIAVFQLPSHLRGANERLAHAAAMPEAAYTAAIEISTPPSAAAVPGESILTVLKATNTSGVSWDQSTSGSLRIGNHWRTPAGTMVIQDDGRAAIPPVVQPGESFTAAVMATAPTEPGEYVCEFDLVHEGISWFHDKGSKTVHCRITVREAAGRPHLSAGVNVSYPALGALPDIYEGLPDHGEITDFPMHGIPRDAVLRLIDEHGGVLFHVEPDERAPEWWGFRYYVQKA